MKNTFIAFLFLFSIQAIAQQDTLWLGPKTDFGHIVLEKDEADYYQLKAIENDNGYTQNAFYKSHELFSETAYFKKEKEVKTTYYNKDKSIIYKEMHTKEHYKRFYSNDIEAFSMPSAYSNFYNLDKFILTGEEIEPIKNFKDYIYTLNYDSGQNALIIDVKKEVFKTFYPNGNLASELIKNKNGYLFKSYFWNNQVHQEAQLNFELFVNGYYKRYYMNGNIHESGMYFYAPSQTINNGLSDPDTYKSGIWKTYYPNGNLYKEDIKKPYFDEDMPFTVWSEIEVEETVIESVDTNYKKDQKTETVNETETPVKTKPVKKIKLYDIDGKFLKSVDKSDYKAIYSVYENELRRYILGLIVAKEKDVFTEEEAKTITFNKAEFRYFQYDKPFNGNILRKENYREGYVFYYYKNGKSISTIKIIDDEDFGIIKRVNYDKHLKKDEEISYETGDIIKSGGDDYSLRVFREYQKITTDNGKIYKHKYNIVPCILNYIKKQENEQKQSYSSYIFIPSIISATQNETTYIYGNTISQSLIRKLLSYEVRF